MYQYWYLIKIGSVEEKNNTCKITKKCQLFFYKKKNVTVRFTGSYSSLGRKLLENKCIFNKPFPI